MKRNTGPLLLVAGAAVVALIAAVVLAVRGGERSATPQVPVTGPTTTDYTVPEDWNGDPAELPPPEIPVAPPVTQTTPPNEFADRATDQGRTWFDRLGSPGEEVCQPWGVAVFGYGYGDDPQVAAEDLTFYLDHTDQWPDPEVPARLTRLRDILAAGSWPDETGWAELGAGGFDEWVGLGCAIGWPHRDVFGVDTGAGD